MIAPPLSPAACRGFTLIELLVTMAVLAIVASIALPSFAGMLARNQVVAAANELMATLQFARHEAVRSNATVQVCGSHDGRACAVGAWQQWIVRRGNGAVLRVGNIPAAVHAQAGGVFRSGVQFDPAGLLHGRGGQEQQGELLLCSPRTPHRFALSATGGVRLTLAAAAPGVCA